LGRSPGLLTKPRRPCKAKRNGLFYLFFSAGNAAL
jgi:hypothetical protein